MPTPMHPLERTPPHRRQRRCTRSSAHPQLAGTQDHRAGMVLLRAQRHMRRSRYPRSSPHHCGTHAATPLPLCTIPPTTPRRYYYYQYPRRWPRSTRMCSAFIFFRVPTLSLAGRFRARRFRARTRTHAPAHMHAQERPTTNDATCGPPAWLQCEKKNLRFVHEHKKDGDFWHILRAFFFVRCCSEGCPNAPSMGVGVCCLGTRGLSPLPRSVSENSNSPFLCS